ncbi:TIGR01459 family HAD-type hydrolase [Enterovirga aerilata]|uniref:TIGR01459 family HAD-type hydrolase n=1 Tax=Enterovirga aerilata TaxID=2730920 RepID=A0A849IF19_9HYPH|nr:TIGR01459 family HAD-type hydrolase [Enterovirga sp. DB1703]
MSTQPQARQAELPSVEFVTRFEALAPRYDLLLCDVWGVLHDGLRAFPDAGSALQRYREGGGRVILVSNAPRPGSSVAAQLDGLGVPRAAYDAIVTSGDLTRAAVIRRGDDPLHHIGPERDLPLFDGLPVRFASLEEADYVVCTGLFDDEHETVADYAPTLRRMRERGLWMVCANPDIVVERGHQLVLCAGALAAAYEALGGETYTGGKPHRPIYEEAAALGAKLIGRDPSASRILAIGDAIRTDVAGGRSFGVDVLLVARGIHAADIGYRPGKVDESQALAWLAAQDFQPTALAPELVW